MSLILAIYVTNHDGNVINSVNLQTLCWAGLAADSVFQLQTTQQSRAISRELARRIAFGIMVLMIGNGAWHSSTETMGTERHPKGRIRISKGII